MGRQSVMLYAAGDRRYDDCGTMAITYVVLNALLQILAGLREKRYAVKETGRRRSDAVRRLRCV